jgi:zinc protease
MFAICNPANIDKVDAASKEELAKMLKDGVTDKEVAEAKKAYLKMLKTNRSGDGPLANQLASGLHNGRTFAYYADLEKKIDELTPEQVSAAFRKHIHADKLIVVRAGDFKTKKGSAEK